MCGGVEHILMYTGPCGIFKVNAWSSGNSHPEQSLDALIVLVKCNCVDTHVTLLAGSVCLWWELKEPKGSKGEGGN